MWKIYDNICKLFSTIIIGEQYIIEADPDIIPIVVDTLNDGIYNIIIDHLNKNIEFYNI